MQATGKRLSKLFLQYQYNRTIQTQTAPFVNANLNNNLKIASISPDLEKRMVEVKWEDGKRAQFPFVWLRDCAPLAMLRPDNDPKCQFTAATRTLTLNELNVQVKPEKLELNTQNDGILIQWPPYYEVKYRSDWLREHLSSMPSLSVRGKLIQPWGRSDLEKSLPQTTTDELLNGDQNILRQKLLDMAKYGVLLIHGGGKGEFDVLKSFGYQLSQLERNKFRAYPHHVQGMHTGGPFKSAIPPVCLLFIHEEPEDSTIQICDGYRVANLLRDAHPSMFTFLCNTLIEYKVIGKNGQLKDQKWPIFTLAANGDVRQVVFNNALRSSRIVVAPDSLEDYYNALKTFNSYCYQSKNMFNLHVKKGDLVLIANQRILHGNPAFSNNVTNWVDEVFLPDEPLMQTLKRVQKIN